MRRNQHDPRIQHLRETAMRHGGLEHPFHEESGKPAFGHPMRGFGDFPPGPPGWGGPYGRGHRGRGRGGRRGRRGDVRAAILVLLGEQPRHGYEIIGEITERSNGLWRPSPGSVYPTLQMLADEGLVTSDDSGGKKLFEVTEKGRATAAKHETNPPWEQIAHDVDPNEVRLREATGTMMAAMKQVSVAGSDAQKGRAADVLDDARRRVYAILGEADSGTQSGEDDPEQDG